MKCFYLKIFLLNFILIFQNVCAQAFDNDFERYGWKNNSVNETLADSLPVDFPKITIDSLINPAPGYIFMEGLRTDGVTPYYIMTLDSSGKPVYYFKPLIAGIDFKMQPNGRFSYGSPIMLGDKYDAGPLTVQNVYVVENILDSSYKIIDNVQMKNGYLADVHDFQILPNGNFLLIGYEPNYVDMSKIVPGGNPNAKAIGTVIQELDNSKRCVFQWRSLDHIPITDTKDNVRNQTFEHVHGSSFYLDTDGNLIISLVSSFEIIKIDMVSGQIIWRLGGAHNQFDITGEHEENAPNYFTFQHDIKRLGDGNLLFYDNGYAKNPWYSRAVEYSLDEQNKKASLVWEYRHNPDISAYAMGSAQRLSNGNTLINWGMIFQGYYKTITEVTPEKTVAFEMSFPSDTYYSYRAFKYQLPACQPVADVTIYETLEGNTYSFDDTKDTTGVSIYLEHLDAFIYDIVNVKKYECTPLNPVYSGEAPVIMPCRFVVSMKSVNSYSGEIRFDLTTLPPRFNPDSLKVYYRPNEASGTFTQLPTHYDVSENNIVANTSFTGEYVIGFERTAANIYPPSLLYPFDKKALKNGQPVQLIWSPTGRYDYFQLQISDDSLFNQTIINKFNMKTPLDTENLNQNMTYYWRSRTFYKDLISNWSDVRSFSFSAPFMRLDTPKGGETWYIDSTQIVRWETNLPDSLDSLSIMLFRNGSEQAAIKDTIFSYTNSYAWKIPKTIPEDSTYTVKITSLKESSLSCESELPFTIKLAPTGVSNDTNTPDGIEISNYPNPAGEMVRFKFTIENDGNTNLKIFDYLGRETAIVYAGELRAGTYIIDWNSTMLNNGNYFYQLISGSKSKTGKLVIIK